MIFIWVQSLQYQIESTMNRDGMVIIGFGNSSGSMSGKIVEEQYGVIERLNQKPRMGVPVVKPAKLTLIEMDHFMSLLSLRRNQTLINNFLNITDEEDLTKLYEDQEEAKIRLKNIDEELKTTSIVAADFKINKFMNDTKANEATAHAYMMEFSNNVERAVEKFKERDAIIRNFAQKNGSTYEVALNILRENGYNAQVFEY